MNSQSRESGFLADGHERLYAAVEPQIRVDVEREYACRLANASLIERWRIKREIEKQIVQRVEQIAPPDALY